MIIAMGTIGGGGAKSGKGTAPTAGGSPKSLAPKMPAPKTPASSPAVPNGPQVHRRQGKGKGGMGSMTITSVPLHDEALAWLEKNAGSGKFGKIDKTRVAVAGMSCGGLEA